jgi:anti-sigma regulatory factor (Ser/Thr protein kinase)
MPADPSSTRNHQRSPPSTARALFRLPPHAQAARMGRQSVRHVLAGTQDEVLERIELLVSELVTNSVTHAALAPEQNVDLKVLTRPGGVRVEVADAGSHFDPEEQPAPGAESRWGLFLLNQMADRWGMDRRDPGKTVWFEVDL